MFDKEASSFRLTALDLHLITSSPGKRDEFFLSSFSSSSSSFSSSSLALNSRERQRRKQDSRKNVKSLKWNSGNRFLLSLSFLVMTNETNAEKDAPNGGSLISVISFSVPKKVQIKSDLCSSLFFFSLLSSTHHCYRCFLRLFPVTQAVTIEHFPLVFLSAFFFLLVKA